MVTSVLAIELIPSLFDTVFDTDAGRESTINSPVYSSNPNFHEDSKASGLSLSRATEVGGSVCSVEPDDIDEFTAGYIMKCFENNIYPGIVYHVYQTEPWDPVGELHLEKYETGCVDVTPGVGYTYTTYYCTGAGVGSCIDTDGGILPKTYGVVTVTDADGDTTKSYDDCYSDGYTLKERFCDTDLTVSTEAINCYDRYGSNYYCEDGACAQCTSEHEKRCLNNYVYWYDSCGNIGDIYDYCSSSEICSNGVCVDEGNDCTPEYEKKCAGQDVYWYDSCGNLGDMYDDCSSTETCSNGACVGGGTTGSSDIRIYRVEVIDSIYSGYKLKLPYIISGGDLAISIRNYGDEPGTVNLEYGIFPKVWLQAHNLIPPEYCEDCPENWGYPSWSELSRYADLTMQESCNENEDFVGSIKIENLEVDEDITIPVSGFLSVTNTFMPRAPIEDSEFNDGTTAVDPLGEYVLFTEIYVECGVAGNNVIVESTGKNLHISSHGKVTHSDNRYIFEADDPGTWAYLPIEVTGLPGPTVQCTTFTERRSCDDKNSCTFDTCVDGLCTHSLREEAPDCLSGTCPDELSDGIDCTEDICNEETGFQISHEWDYTKEGCGDGPGSGIGGSLQKGATKEDLNDKSFEELKGSMCTSDTQCEAGSDCFKVSKLIEKGIITESVGEDLKDDHEEWAHSIHTALGSAVTGAVACAYFGPWASGICAAGGLILSTFIDDIGETDRIGYCYIEEPSIYSEYFNKLAHFIQDTFDIESFETSKMLSIGILGALLFIIIGLLTSPPRRR